MGTKYRNGTSYHGAFPAQVIQELVQDLCDMIYPVGCYFETTDTDFNPNDVFVGTWVLEAEGLVHISSGENYEVSTDAQDGGEATHTLTADESGIQAHNTVSSGYISAGITGGSHAHTSRHRISGNLGGDYAAPPTSGKSGSSGDRTGVVLSTSSAHTHDLPNHTHSINGASAKVGHNNMQPYKIVNRWYRTE